MLLANERKTDIVNIEKLENGIRHAKLGAMIVKSGVFLQSLNWLLNGIMKRIGVKGMMWKIRKFIDLLI